MSPPFPVPTPMPATARALAALGRFAQRHPVLGTLAAIMVAVLIPIGLTPVATAAAAAGASLLVLAPGTAIAAVGFGIALAIAYDPRRAGAHAQRLAAQQAARALIRRAMRPRASRQRFAEPTAAGDLDPAMPPVGLSSGAGRPANQAPAKAEHRVPRRPRPERELA